MNTNDQAEMLIAAVAHKLNELQSTGPKAFANVLTAKLNKIKSSKNLYSFGSNLKKAEELYGHFILTEDTAVGLECHKQLLSLEDLCL